MNGIYYSHTSRAGSEQSVHVHSACAFINYLPTTSQDILMHIECFNAYWLDSAYWCQYCIS